MHAEVFVVPPVLSSCTLGLATAVCTLAPGFGHCHGKGTFLSKVLAQTKGSVRIKKTQKQV